MKFTGRKGWQASYKDTWNLDYTLSPIIAAGLREFIKVSKDPNKCTGIPYGLDTRHLGPLDDEAEEEKFKESQEEWIETLEKMLYAFENPTEPEPPEGTYYWEEGDIEKVKVNEKLRKQFNMECEEWHRKRKEGLALFAEYYSSLWW